MRISILCLGVLALSACTKKEEKVSLPESSIVAGATPAPEAPAAAAVPIAEAPAAAQAPAAQTAPASDASAVAPPATTPAAAASAPAGAPANGEGTNVQSRLTGEVSSQRKTSMAFRVTGFIQEIKSKPGDSCKKGQVLATLDDRDYRLSLDIARSQRDVARVAMGNAKSEFDREEELRRQNVSTEAMYDKLKAGYDKARLDLQLAELNLKKAEQAMQDTKLTAPYDCVVTKQLKYVGENVQSGNVALEIYDTTNPELNFSVPERMAGKLKVGDSIEVTIPATGFKGAVPIIRLVPVVEESSRTFRVITAAPEDPRIVPGLYAEAMLR